MSTRKRIVILGGGFAGALGEAVPLEVAGPQMGVTEPLPWFIHPVVGVSTKIPGEVIYMRQIPRGNVIFGGVKRCAAALDELITQLRKG